MPIIFLTASTLLANKLEAFERGRVRFDVALERPARTGEVCLEFAVSDDGIGIPTDVRQRIFEPFFRGPGLERQPGIGLGLAFSQRLLQAMDSEFRLESAPGAGSRFSFVLRLALAPPGPDGSHEPPDDEEPGRGPAEPGRPLAEAPAVLVARHRPSASELAAFRDFLDRGEVLSVERWAAGLAAASPAFSGLHAEVAVICGAVDLRALERLYAELGGALPGL